VIQQVFTWTFPLAVPFWALMVFAPSWRWTGRIISSPLIVLPTVAAYVALVADHLPELWATTSRPNSTRCARSSRHPPGRRDLGATHRMGPVHRPLDAPGEQVAANTPAGDGTGVRTDDPAVPVRFLDLPRRALGRRLRCDAGNTGTTVVTGQ
jgi:hypothetical protein